MQLKLNNETLYAINALEEKGYLAYVVGDFVRDSLLNQTPNDMDIVTDATLAEIRNLFSEYKIVDYKKKSLSLGVIINNFYIEISTFNGSTLEDDLLNRDFTINAIAYSPSKGIIDPLDGIKDLENKIIKTPKAPIVSICSSPIRILRAIYLSVKKGFKIDSELNEVINTRAGLLNNENPTRFKKFLDFVLESKKPSLIIEMYFNVFSVIFPSLKAIYKFEQHSKWHHLDVLNHTLAVLDFTTNNIVLRYAALFHDVEKPQCFTLDEYGEGHFYNHYIYSAETAKYELLRLNYSKDFVNRVYNLILYHDRRLENRDIVIKRFLKDFGTKDLDLYFELKKCDCLGQNPKYYNRLEELDLIKERAFELAKEM